MGEAWLRLMGMGRERILQLFESLSETAWPAIQGRLVEVTRRATPPGSSLVGMCDYHMSSGGKRLRAILPLMVADALNQPTESMIGVGAACEMLHNATLVHDDLQDGDATRRGVPTVWKAYGAPQAINLGDAMFYYTLLLAMGANLPQDRERRFVSRLLTDTLRVIDGQEREFLLKRMPTPTLDSYFRMVEGKTSGLFQLPMAGAAEALGATEDEIHALEQAARHLGVLFQIQDDLLDLYGDKGRSDRATDIAEGKRSALAVFVVENAEHEVSSRLVEILNAPREATSAAMIEEALAIFEREGAKRFAVAELRQRQNQAESAVLAFPKLSALVSGLSALFLKPIAGLD